MSVNVNWRPAIEKKKSVKIALGELLLKIYILPRSDKYFGRTDELGFAALTPGFGRLQILHTAQTSFRKSKRFFSTQF